MCSVALQLQDIYKPIRSDLDRVQQGICEQLRTSDQQLTSVLDLISQRQGKMIRPALVLLCGRLISEINEDHIDFAAMVELIHMASLLHDDVIDKDSLRRGQPTANMLWGNTTAILLGDFLLSRAFTLSASSRYKGTSKVLAQTAQALCTGELKQNLMKGSWELGEEDYYTIIQDKTAALFQCSCQLAAMASGANEDQIHAMGCFGYEFGIAFQIADDLRDMLSNEKHEGKTVGTDFREGKLTLPLIHWINSEPALRQDRIEQLNKFKEPVRLTEHIELTESIHYASQQALERTRKAKHHLQSFPDNSARVILEKLLEKILTDIV